MPICNTNEFLNNLEKKKIMCIDIGKNKCGIALSDPLNKFSLPHKVLRVSERKIYEELINIIENYDINLIVVGLPLNDDNSLNKQCQSVIDRTKYSNLTTHIHLSRGERSALATYASKVL